MATTRVTTFWTACLTAVVSVFARLLTALGVKREGAAAPLPAVVIPTQQTAARRRAAVAPALCVPPLEMVRRPRKPGSLPPTIKQRIHAEAHGSSPAVRRLAAVDDPMAMPITVPAQREATAAVETASSGTGSRAQAAVEPGARAQASAEPKPNARHAAPVPLPLSR
ncbi:DUF6344 domain-containing protein [Streptomyces sp. ICBB 8177]|uniref:DUF6344 domain-containing protein n=1 Tax=Streptomyces sp. ICBB 8177 TaxID=563922 RepID=UPI000D680510|nr:DUF6344 domain-containing protein [Streptomyces sp. ICBB 8177]PWI42590.1 hypothetical protein CK485_09655 [Streptomyces sp. ICBB 8177]